MDTWNTKLASELYDHDVVRHMGFVDWVAGNVLGGTLVCFWPDKRNRLGKRHTGPMTIWFPRSEKVEFTR